MEILLNIKVVKGLLLSQNIFFSLFIYFSKYRENSFEGDIANMKSLFCITREREIDFCERGREKREESFITFPNHSSIQLWWCVR